MYARALVTGALEEANKTKYNSMGRSKEEAIASLDSAEPVYLQQKDIDRLNKKIEGYEAKFEEIKKLGARDAEKIYLERQIKHLKQQKELSILKKEREFLQSIQ